MEDVIRGGARARSRCACGSVHGHEVVDDISWKIGFPVRDGKLYKILFPRRDVKAAGDGALAHASNTVRICLER